MNVLFLDVDGVLNSLEFYERLRAKYNYDGAWQNGLLDQECVMRLYKIVKSTQACIVMTSSWRTNPAQMTKIVNQLRAYNLEIYGITEINGLSRGQQILNWVRAMKANNYVVLDDDDDVVDMDMFRHWVQTDYTCGLSDSDVCMAIHILEANIK